MCEENKEIVIIDGRTGFRMNQRNEKPKDEKPKDEKPIANAKCGICKKELIFKGEPITPIIYDGNSVCEILCLIKLFVKLKKFDDTDLSITIQEIEDFQSEFHDLIHC